MDIKNKEVAECDNIDTEQRIFNAAQTLFLQKGLSDTTMQDIADKAAAAATRPEYRAPPCTTTSEARTDCLRKASTTSSAT